LLSIKVTSIAHSLYEKVVSEFVVSSIPSKIVIVRIKKGLIYSIVIQIIRRVAIYTAPCPASTTTPVCKRHITVNTIVIPSIVDAGMP
jgi:hypothetical protein